MRALQEGPCGQADRNEHPGVWGISCGIGEVELGSGAELWGCCQWGKPHSWAQSHCHGHREGQLLLVNSLWVLYGVYKAFIPFLGFQDFPSCSVSSAAQRETPSLRGLQDLVVQLDITAVIDWFFTGLIRLSLALCIWATSVLHAFILVPQCVPVFLLLPTWSSNIQ